MADLRENVFAHFAATGNFFLRQQPRRASWVTRVTADIEALSEIFTGGIIGTGCTNLVMGCFSVLAAANQRVADFDPRNRAAEAFTVVTTLFRRAVTPTQQRVRVLIARINAMLAEHINGVAVLQLFNRRNRASVSSTST